MLLSIKNYAGIIGTLSDQVARTLQTCDLVRPSAHCSLIPSNKFLLLTSSSFFGRLYYLYTAFSNASIIYQGLHGTLTLCPFSSPPLSITCLQCLAVGVVEGWNPPVAVPSLSSDTTPLWAALRSWDTTHTNIGIINNT